MQNVNFCNNFTKNIKVLEKNAVNIIKEKLKGTQNYGNGSVTSEIIGSYCTNA